MKLNSKLIYKILNKNKCQDIGVFISILSYKYRNLYDISEKDFIKSLKNSFKTIEKSIKENFNVCIDCGHEWEGNENYCPSCKSCNIKAEK